MPELFFRDAPLSDTEMLVASALSRAATYTYGAESRLQWSETVQLVAGTLFDRNDWGPNMTHSMKQFTNFLDLCGWTNPAFPENILNVG